MGFLSKLHNCCQSTAYWLTNVSDVDENGHYYRNSSSNLMKMLLGGAITTSAFGFYEFSQKKYCEEPETLKRTIAITTVGLIGTVVMITKIIKNHLEANSLIKERNCFLNNYKETHNFFIEFESKKTLETIKTELEKKLEKEENEQAVLNDRIISTINNQTQHCSIAMLPEEIIGSIFQLLAFNDLLKVSLTCKQWFVLSSSDTFWKPLITQKLSARGIMPDSKDVLSRNGYILHLTKQSMNEDFAFFSLCEQILSKPPR